MLELCRCPNIYGPDCTYCKAVQRAKKAKEVEIRRKMKEETNKSEMQIKRIILLEEELKKIEEVKCRGAILRSKVKYTIEGEKCTIFFFDLEKNIGR